MPCPSRPNTFAQALHSDIDRDGDRAELDAADCQFVERSKRNWELAPIYKPNKATKSSIRSHDRVSTSWETALYAVLQRLLVIVVMHVMMKHRELVIFVMHIVMEMQGASISCHAHCDGNAVLMIPAMHIVMEMQSANDSCQAHCDEMQATRNTCQTHYGEMLGANDSCRAHYDEMQGARVSCHAHCDGNAGC